MTPELVVSRSSEHSTFCRISLVENFLKRYASAMKLRTKSIVLGLACSNILGLALLAASMLCAQAVGGAYILVASNFVIIPLLMGMVSAYFFGSWTQVVGNLSRKKTSTNCFN
jgi:hypothetical protein